MSHFTSHMTCTCTFLPIDCHGQVRNPQAVGYLSHPGLLRFFHKGKDSDTEQGLVSEGIQVVM